MNYKIIYFNLYLCIDDEDESTASTKDHIRVESRIKKVNLKENIEIVEILKH